MDPYTEAERAQILGRAASRHGPPVWLAVLVGLALTVVCGHFAGSMMGLERPEALRELAPYTASAGVVLLLGLVFRDIWLAIAVRKELRDAHCHRCGENLIGLPFVAGRVGCPRCGARSHLLSPPLPDGNVLARRMVHAACPNCHQPFGPFHPGRHPVKCARCGAVCEVSELGEAVPS